MGQHTISVLLSCAALIFGDGIVSLGLGRHYSVYLIPCPTIFSVSDTWSCDLMGIWKGGSINLYSRLIALDSVAHGPYFAPKWWPTLKLKGQSGNGRWIFMGKSIPSILCLERGRERRGRLVFRWLQSLLLSLLAVAILFPWLRSLFWNFQCFALANFNKIQCFS